MTNTLQTVQAGNPAPLITNLMSKAGKVTGQRFTFTTSHRAADIKAALVRGNPKLKGRELTDKVNEVLRGEVDLRRQVGVAALQAAFDEGYVPDSLDLKARSGVLKLVKPGGQAKKADELTVAELEALLAAKKAEKN